MNKQQKEFRANNSELQKRKDRKQYQSQKKKRVAYAKEYRKKHPDRTKRTNLKVKYGISLEEYNDMKERQQGKCAICGKHEDSLKKSLCVDHCHSTGVIRGLLCDTCNKFLGFYEKLKGQCELYLRKE
ncbi:MAG: hypothetical protein CMB80_01880 [Flammeovirgaceae bacterium]|nr:hypothetical protein [Flammeovirgaceae bacterium]